MLRSVERAPKPRTITTRLIHHLRSRSFDLIGSMSFSSIPICDSRQADLASTTAAYQVWYSRGKNLASHERYAAALDCFDVALNIQANQQHALVFRGVMLAHLELYESAIETFDRALNVAPHCREAWIFRGAVLTRLNRCAEAKQSYTQALKLRSDSTETFPMWLPNLNAS